MSSSLVAIVAVIIGGGGISAALVAFRKLPAEVESISVIAAEKAVAAMSSALDQREKDLASARGELVTATERSAECIAELADLRVERNGLAGRVMELEGQRASLANRVRHLEEVLARHGLNGETA